MSTIYIKLNPRAPEIALKLEEKVQNIKEINDYALTLQVNYREANTVLYFKELSYINFDEYFVEIQFMNNSTYYLNYENILEFCIVNAKSLKNGKGSEYV